MKTFDVKFEKAELCNKRKKKTENEEDFEDYLKSLPLTTLFPEIKVTINGEEKNGLGGLKINGKDESNLKISDLVKSIDFGYK